MDPELPEIPAAHDLADRATAELRSRLPNGWRTWEPSRDIGTDLLLDVGQGDRPTGKRVAVQLKSPTAPSWSDGRISYELKVSTLNHLLQSPDPAALVLYSSVHYTFFWTDLRRYAYKRLETDGVGWQDQQTVSVSVREDRELANDEAFYEMVDRLWGADEFRLEDLRDEQSDAVRLGCCELLVSLEENDRQPLPDATALLTRALGRDLSEDEATRLLQDQAPGLFLLDEEDNEIRRHQEPSLAGLRSIFHLAREQAPNFLETFGWIESSGTEDIGRLTARYVTEQDYPVEILEALRDASPKAWLEALSDLLSNGPEHLASRPGLKLTQEREPSTDDLPQRVVRHLDFIDPQTRRAAREGLGSDAGRGIIVVPSTDRAYLLETTAVLPEDDPPPRLRVHGADGSDLTSRTPILVLEEPRTRWLVGVRGVLTDLDRPAVRTLTSQKRPVVEAPQIDGIPFLIRGGQEGNEQFHEEIPAFRHRVEGYTYWEVIFDLEPDSSWIPGPLHDQARSLVEAGEDFVFNLELYEPPRFSGIPVDVVQTVEDRWGPVRLGEPERET